VKKKEVDGQEKCIKTSRRSETTWSMKRRVRTRSISLSEKKKWLAKMAKKNDGYGTKSFGTRVIPFRLLEMGRFKRKANYSP